MVSPTGKGRPRRAVITDDYGKSYGVRFEDDGSTDRITKKKCRVIPGRAPTPPLEPLPAAELAARAAQPLPPASAAPLAVRGPIPKPTPPARSPLYLAWVRKKRCCHCAQALLPQEYPTEADHEGPRGVGQKTSDFLTIPLCTRCHNCITSTHRLPDLLESKRLCKQVLFSRELTEEIIHGAQVDLLQEVFDRLPAELRITLYEAALRTVETATLKKALS